nr:MAG TPA: hypothetical protein [Caudoviricetes sp.]
MNIFLPTDETAAARWQEYAGASTRKVTSTRRCWLAARPPRESTRR